MLLQSQDGLRHHTSVPSLSKGDLGSASGVVLTGRSWKSFQRWWAKEVESNLRTALRESAKRMIVPVRESNQRGGFPELSSANYFLAFELEVPAGMDSDGVDEAVPYREEEEHPRSPGERIVQPPELAPAVSSAGPDPYDDGISLFMLGVLTGAGVSIVSMVSLLAAFLVLGR